MPPFDQVKFKFTAVRDSPPYGRWDGFLQICGIKLFTRDGEVFEAVSASCPDGDCPYGEGPENAIDNTTENKWLDFGFKYGGSEIIINLGKSTNIPFYEIVSGNDAEGRDPISWIIETNHEEEGWTVVREVTDFEAPAARKTGYGRLPLGEVDSLSASINEELAKEEVAAEKAEDDKLLLEHSRELAQRFGVPRPTIIPEPKLVPDWKWDLDQAFYELKCGKVPDTSFPIIHETSYQFQDYGTEQSMKSYNSIFELLKKAREEGLGHSQEVVTKNSTVTCNGKETNQGLLLYREYFGALHPSRLGHQPGDHIAHLNATVKAINRLPIHTETCVSYNAMFDIDLGEEKTVTEVGFTYTPWDRISTDTFDVYIDGEHVGTKTVPKSADQTIADKVNTEFGYELKDCMPKLYPLFRNSRDAYQSCLDTVREQDSKALQALEDLPDEIPSDPPLQPVNDADSLWRDAKEAQRFIKELVGPGTSWLNEDPGWILPEDQSVEWLEKATDPSVKSRKRGTEKCKYKYKGNFNRLRDVSRIGLEFESITMMFEAIKKLQDKVDVLQLENRFFNPTPLGWRDVSMLVKIPIFDGASYHITELQLQLTPFVNARKHAHEYYEEIRSLLPTLCKGCPSKELDRVQYCIIDSLDMGDVINHGHGNPFTNRLNACLLPIEPRKARRVRIEFHNCGSGDFAQRFCFLHVRGPSDTTNIGV